jgi:hypothetical protein
VPASPGQALARSDERQHPNLELELNGETRLESDAQPERDGLLDRTVGTERHRSGLKLVSGEVLL